MECKSGIRHPLPGNGGGSKTENSYPRSAIATLSVFLLLAGAACLNPSPSGAGPIHLNDDIEYMRAARAFRYGYFPKKYTLSDVQARGQDFQPITNDYPNFGFTEEALWLKGQFLNRGELPIFLELASSRFREIEIVQVLEAAAEATVAPGPTVSSPGAQPEIDAETNETGARERILSRFRSSQTEDREHPYFRFPIEKNASQSTIYVRILAGDLLTIPIYLWPESTLRRVDTIRHFGYGAFFGLMVSLSIYNFFIYFSTRDRAYLYYVLYILAFAGFLAVTYGYQSYFLPLAQALQIKIAPLLSIVTSSFALLFSYRFLLIKKYSAGLGRAAVIVAGAGPALMLAVALAPTSPAILIGNIYPVLCVALVSLCILISWKSGFKPARYFAIAWGFLLLSVIYFVAGNLTLVEGTFLSHYGVIFGVSFEATLLSLALGYRINDLRESEEVARRQLVEEQNRALETQKKYTESFRRFVPGEFLEYMGRDSILDVARGDSIQKEMTVLFSDLRDFTEFSESAGEELVFHFLNLYLEQMEPIIQKNGGFIDKFIGDAIMALFPDPASALHAADRMGAELQNMQSSPGSEPGQIMRSGCGLHYGPLMLGTVGSPRRLETTVIGDTVNTASRLESMNRTLGTTILFSRAVYDQLESDSGLLKHIRQVGHWTLRGKSEKQQLYEMFSGDPDPLREFKRRTSGDLQFLLEQMDESPEVRPTLIKQIDELLGQCPGGQRDFPLEFLRSKVVRESGSVS